MTTKERRLRDTPASVTR